MPFVCSEERPNTSERPTRFPAVAILLPVTVLAQQVNIDFNKEADFTKYKTYAYQVCHRVENPLVDKRIVRLESRILMEGLIRAEADPDVNVTYHSSNLGIRCQHQHLGLWLRKRLVQGTWR